MVHTKEKHVWNVEGKAVRAESCGAQTSVHFLPPTFFTAHLVPVICCGLFSVPTAALRAFSSFSHPTSAVNEPPGVVLQPGHRKCPELKRSPRWIASCQNALWDTLFEALFLLLPFTLLVTSSSGLCTDGRGRRTGSLRALGKVLHLSGP